MIFLLLKGICERVRLIALLKSKERVISFLLIDYKYSNVSNISEDDSYFYFSRGKRCIIALAFLYINLSFKFLYEKVYNLKNGDKSSILFQNNSLKYFIENMISI